MLAAKPQLFAMIHTSGTADLIAHSHASSMLQHRQVRREGNEAVLIVGRVDHFCVAVERVSIVLEKIVGQWGFANKS